MVPALSLSVPKSSTELLRYPFQRQSIFFRPRRQESDGDVRKRNGSGTGTKRHVPRKQRVKKFGLQNDIQGTVVKARSIRTPSCGQAFSGLFADNGMIN
jgi:hypothetical protein